jgi:hypothetical protein
MTVLSALLVVWSLSTAIFVMLIIYRGHLTRHEIGEVFLNENVDHDREVEHEEIGRRIDQIDPYLKGVCAVAAFMTVTVIGVYVAEILPTVHFFH